MRDRKGVIWSSDRLIPKDKCYECNSMSEIHYHHIVPYSFGGRKTIPLCEICHGKVHNRNFTEHSNLIKEKLKQKRKEGVILGRRKGSIENDETVLSRYSNVVELHNKGMSLRTIASITNTSINTIRKVIKICKKVNG
jgi:hypothetical protein